MAILPSSTPEQKPPAHTRRMSKEDGLCLYDGIASTFKSCQGKADFKKTLCSLTWLFHFVKCGLLFFFLPKIPHEYHMGKNKPVQVLHSVKPVAFTFTLD
jgi:hypothetical protein